MNERLLVRIPLGYRANYLDEELIREVVVQNERQFEPFFSRVIDVDDGRVQVVEGTLEIDAVNLDADNTGSVEVQFMSAFYAGCRDLNSADWHPEVLHFVLEGETLVFDIELPPLWRVDN